MPDGSQNINVAITASLDGAQDAFTRMGAQVSALRVPVGGLRSDLGVLNSQLAAAASGGMKALATEGEHAAGVLNFLQRESKHVIAVFDEFARGARGQMVSSLGAMIRDSGGLSLALAGLIGTAGIALLANRLRAGAVAMADLGEKTVNTAAAIGTSPHEFSLLSNALRLVGGDANEASHTIEQLARNLQAALIDPTGRAAKAAASLGISQAQLRQASSDLGFAFDLLADRFNRFADSPAKTADFEALLGRSMDRLVPALRQGAAGFDELKARAEATGNVLGNDEAIAFAELASRMHEMSETLSGEMTRSFVNLIPVIDTSITVVETLGQVVGATVSILGGMAADIGRLANAIYHAVSAALAMMNGLALEAARVVHGISAAIGALIHGNLAGMSDAFQKAFEHSADAADQNTKRITADIDAINADIGRMLGLSTPGGGRTEGSPFGAAGAAKPQVAPLQGGGGGRAGGGGGESQVEAWREQLQQQLEAERNFFKDSTAEEAAFWKEKLALTQAGSKERAQVQSIVYGLEKQQAQQGLRDYEEGISRQEALDRSYLAAFTANMKEMAATHQITKQQEYGFDIQYAAQLEAQEKARLETLIADDRLSQAEKERYYQQLLELEAQYTQKIYGFETEAANNSANAWKEAAKQIGDAFATALTDILTRSKTTIQALSDLLNSLLRDTLKSTLTGIVGSLLGSGGGAGGGGAGGGGLNLTSLLFGQAGLGNLVFGSGGLNGALGLGSGGLLGALGIGGGAGAAAGGGLFGWLGSLLGGGASLGAGTDAGLAALGIAAAPLGFSKGGIVPSAAGGWSVPQLGSGGVLAQLHSNEMVLPANISAGLQGMIGAGGGGGHTFNIGISATDASSVARLFASNGSALVAALNKALRNGGSLYAGAYS